MSLTPAEVRVAHWIAVGYTYREIAGILECTEHTVRVHVRNAAKKIGGDGKPQHQVRDWYHRRFPPYAHAENR